MRSLLTGTLTLALLGLGAGLGLGSFSGLWGDLLQPCKQLLELELAIILLESTSVIWWDVQ